MQYKYIIANLPKIGAEQNRTNY